MDNNSKLYSHREQLNTLVCNVFDEFLKLDTESTNTIDSLNKQLDSLKDDYNSMLVSKVSEHTEELCSLNDKISSLETELDCLKKDNSNKDKFISELQQKVNSFTEETSENKFDIIRGQAKEISAKDKEIIRLREELVKAKHGNIDKNNIGWSPTSSPTPALPVEDVKLDDPKDDPKDDLKDVKSKDEDPDSESDEEYEMITYRKNNYFMNKNKVYEIIKDEDGEDDVGKCIGDWVKHSSGKFKLVKN
jgi:hypothetical protein